MKAPNAHLLCVLLLLFTSFLSAQTSDVSEGCIPLTVNFTPPGGFSSHYWEFGDGVISEEENASHVYTSAGTFTVNFRENSGGPIIGSLTINVYPEPDLMVSADPNSGCGPLLVQFTNNSTVHPNISVTNYLWDFGDGSNMTGNDPAHTYTTTGTFDVFLQVTTNLSSCNTTQVFSDLITVVGPPNVGFITNPNPPASCTAPFTVTFTNTTPNPDNYTFLWDFGNGQTSGQVDPDPITFTDEGNFTVTLTAFDNNNCSGTFSRTINIGDPVVGFAPEKDTVCLGESIQFFNNSAPGTYNWTFGNGADPAMSNLTSPTVQFTEGGFIPFTLEVTSPAGCSSDSSGVIYVEVVDPGFTSNPTYSCDRTLESTFTPNDLNAASYFWDFGDDSTSTEQIPTHLFVNRDTTIYSMNGLLEQEVTLIVTTPSGCVDSLTLIDTIHQPNALFMPDVVDGCVPLTVTFSDSSTNDYDLVLYEWDYGDGSTNTFTNDDDHTHTFTQPGEYPVVLTVTDELGCLDTSYALVIEVGDALSPDFTVDQTEICPGDSISFSPTSFTGADNVDAWHFEADQARSFHCYQEDELTWTFATETGVMDATLYVEFNGCLSQITKTDLVEVKGPIAHIDYSVDCEAPLAIAFRDSSDDATSVLWEFGDGTDSTQNDLTHVYDTTGNYTVYLTAENASTGCPASIDSIVVYVKDIQAEFLPLDSLLCLGNTYELNGSPSIDVDRRCWKGYNWYFSDPNDRPITTSNDTVQHIFEAIGFNTVTLITEDINGCLDTVSQTVKVYGVYPEFVADDNLICLGQLVAFDESTTGDTTLVEWNWDFGDGMSMDMDPSHIFTSSNNPDTAFVTLSVTDVLGCGGEFTLPLPLYEPTSIVTALPSTNICVGDQIDFFATDFTQQGSFLNYSWNFGNGQTSGNQSATITYPNAGNFPVSLTYLEDATGCPGDTINFNVSVQDYPDANFTSNVDGQSVICYPQILLFDDNSSSNSPLSYFWNFGNGQSAIGPTVSNGFDKGTYDVTLTVATSNGCVDNITRSFTLVGPEGTLSLDRNQICNGDDITFTLADTVDISSFTWDFGDGIVQNGGNPTTHTYNFSEIPPNGQTTASLVLRGQNDICEFAIDTTIFIYQVIADFVRNDGIDTTVCLGEEFPFFESATDADLFSWNFGDGSTSQADNPTYVYQNSGTYTVELAVENSILGCRDTLQKTVLVNDLPIVIAEGDTICNDASAFLSVTNENPNSTYNWSPGNLVNSDTTASTETVLADLLPGTVNTFSVTETDDNGCSNSDDVVVYVVPELTIGDLDTIICPGEAITLPVEDTTGLYTLNYTWDPALADLSCTNCSLPQLIPSGSVVVNFAGTDSYGCYDLAEDFVVDVFQAEEIQIPNAFTPDNDGTNDFFNVIIQDPALQKVTKFEVYDRWGQKVYNNENPDEGWDGKFSDQELPSDVYVYIIEISLAGCETFMEKGDITLIR